MDKELLHTYFRGEATPEEEKQIMDWAESSPENYQEYLKERKIWNAILMYSVNPTIKATATHKRLFLSLYKYAAIAVIAFGVGFYTFAPSTATSIDSTRLKAEKPEIAKEYSKTSNKKSYVKIEVKAGDK